MGHIYLKPLLTKILRQTPPVGAIQMYGGASAPAGWLLCDGSSYLRTDYPALFAALGGTSSPWGLPDSTHFNVPDFRGLMPVGANNTSLPNGANASYSTRALNASGGYENGSVITHTHSISAGAMTSQAGSAHSHGTGNSTYQRFVVTGEGDDYKIGRRSIKPGTSTAVTGNWYSDAAPARISSTGDESSHTHKVPASAYTVPAPSGAVAAAGRNMPPFRSINFIICAGNA